MSSKILIPGIQFRGWTNRMIAKRQARASTEDWCVRSSRITGEKICNKQPARKSEINYWWENLKYTTGVKICNKQPAKKHIIIHRMTTVLWLLLTHWVSCTVRRALSGVPCIKGNMNEEIYDLIWWFIYVNANIFTGSCQPLPFAETEHLEHRCHTRHGHNKEIMSNCKGLNLYLQIESI